MTPHATPTERLPLQYLFPTGVHEGGADGVGTLTWPPGLGPFGQVQDMALNEHTTTVICVQGLLSPQECAAIVAQGRALRPASARVELGPDTYRVSHIAWMEPQEPNHWLYHKIGSLFTDINRNYGFALTGMFDALQFTEYGPGQHFDWHVDIGRGQTSLRKISLTVQLSDPADYEGGDLEFVGLGSRPEARAQGAATFFPSYLGHRVSPVTSGVRRSLVAWASGSPYR